MCLGILPKYPRQTSELQPIPTTGRASVGFPHHSSLEGVQRGQHYQLQIPCSSESDRRAKFKRGGQPEKYTSPSLGWYRCQGGRRGPQVRTRGPLCCAEAPATSTPAPPGLHVNETREFKTAGNNSIKNVCAQNAPLNLRRKPWHIVISWGSFCCPHNLILKRFLCAIDADLHVCQRGYYIPSFY